MIDDISYYNFGQLNTYKTRKNKSVLIYVICVILFVLANIIFYLINNDVLYGILVGLLWFIFLNFSLIFVRLKIIQNKRIYAFYKMLSFGKKRAYNLTFVSPGEDMVRDELDFYSYTFKDNNGNIKTLYLYKDVSVSFVVDKCYVIYAIEDLIYGGVIHD